MRSKEFFGRSQRRLRMEHLENRRLFAADLAVADDYWMIQGTDGNDVIAVEQDGIVLTATVNGVESQTWSFLWDGIAVHGKAGNDSIEIDKSVKLPTRLHGGPGNDTIIGSRQDDVICGGWGNDQIDARAGNDEIWGDQMPIPEAPVLVSNERVVVQVGQVVQPPGPMVEPPASDVVWGGEGNDTIHGGLGNDALFGEVGEISSHQLLAPHNPGMIVQPAPDIHQLRNQNDEIYGDEGDDLLHGGPGNDFFHGGAGGDVILANDGYADVILGGPGDTYDTDDLDRFAPWQPEVGPIVQPQNDDPREVADVSFTAHSAYAVDRVLKALPTVTTDFFDDDDWLEDLIDWWDWEE